MVIFITFSIWLFFKLSDRMKTNSRIPIDFWGNILEQ